MINIDAIVFDQKQLDSAIDCGYKNICLCDNSFSLPSADGISYMGIGDVRAVIRLDRERRYNIIFENFEPVIIYTGGYTGITERCAEDVIVPEAIYSSYGSGGGSYAGSYVTSYGLDSRSDTGSYFSLYGSGSYAFSYITSGLANTSSASSYRTSYTFSGSAVLAFLEMYEVYSMQHENVREVFYAAGYGLNLI